MRQPSLVLGVAAVAVLLVVIAGPASAWQEWTFFDPGGGVPYDPGPRRGHSFHLWNNSVYLFGGRDNDIFQEHIPKTYKIVTVNGTLQFSTYDQNPVQEACNNVSSPLCQSTVPLGVYYNDIWEYPLDCVRWSDLSCRMEGWKVVEPGAVLGGCAIVGGVESCSHPTERFEHSSELFEDGTLIVYGGFSRRCEDYCSDVWSFNIVNCKHKGDCRWREIANLGNSGPGRRWKASTVMVNNVFYLFGGHRQWHGFGGTNSVENKWTDTFQYALGGYLDDLWEYRKDSNSWYEVPRIQTCFPNPGIEWAERDNTRCVTFWPPQRAGHVMIFFNSSEAGQNETLLVHGGYRTFYPYPHTNARGAGPGTATVGSDGFTPYPTYPFYLDDVWEYSFGTGKWREVPPIDDIIPDARTEHTIVLAGGVFILFGGYRSNYYFGDFWLFNITTQTWLEKIDYVHAIYPQNCTDDTEVLPGVGEVVRTKSVLGQPTRFTTLDNEYGRAAGHVFVEQPRRRAPGWDGCRDRADGRLDLPVQLQWARPAQRSGHKSIWSDKHRLMLVYGGQANVLEQLKEFDITHATHIVGDMWQHHIDHCPKNCSNQGRCFHGYCYCDDGFYGIDCSNISCPGSWCYMDTARHVQICKHCCHAAYTHIDGEYYVEDERKVPCSFDHPGETHGICDGFGNCQCAPPYMTKDCSVRDCPNNCTFNGWCDIQYPVGRCMCDDGWVGKDCSERVCLNNCSFPNGHCEFGECVCHVTYNPYNRTIEWYYYNGTDCSFVVPFAAAAANSWTVMQMVVVAMLVWVVRRDPHGGWLLGAAEGEAELAGDGDGVGVT